MEDQRVRIQPPALCIPKEDPFGSDRLGRKESAEVLTRIVARIEGPCVLALDAPWGYGKTTFLKMWEAWLRQEAQGFRVVACFNAWETDFTSHPFLTLPSELTKELESCLKNVQGLGLDIYTYRAAEMKFLAFRSAAMKFLRVAVPAISQIAGVVIPVVGAAVGAAVEAALSEAVSDKADTNDYQEAKDAIAEFKAALGELAQGLEKPLVVMIDELDRCRPSYAVELLKVAKHLFAVDNVVFVLAVNRAELVHSIRALYGSGFDAEGYLRRFFDLDFQLPEPSRDRFVQELLDTTRLTSTLSDGEGQAQQDARVLLEAFLSSPELSLRDVQQAVYRLGLVLALLPSDAAPLALHAVVAIVLRTADFAVYQRFVAGETTDKEVVDKVFGLQGTASLRSDGRGYDWWIESHIILGSIDMDVVLEARGQDLPELNSQLLKQYRQLLEAGQPDDADVKHANHVLERVQALWKNMPWQDSAPLRQTYLDSIRRLELLSPELGEDRGSV